jgi:hypothetical protein
MSTYKRTSTRVLLPGKTRPSAVYEGPRGGSYVMKEGAYVGVSKEFVGRHEVRPPASPPRAPRPERLLRAKGRFWNRLALNHREP